MISLLVVILREFRVIRESRRLIALAVCAPPMFGLIIAWQYAPKKLTSIPVTIVDQDHSALSREIIQAILASETFKLGQYAESPDVFPDLAARNLSHICFVFPRYFERDVLAGHTGRVAVFTDATNLLAGNIAQTKANEIFGAYSAAVEMRRLEGQGLSPSSLAEQATLPVNNDFRSWFNPNFNNNYANYLCLGALIVPVQLASLLVAVRAGAREFHPETWSELKSLSPSPLSLILGKSIFYAALVWPGCMITLAMPHFLLDVPFRGSWILVGLMVGCFSAMLATVAFGLSALTRDPLSTSLLSAVLTLPNFLLCGYTWPNFAMPFGVHFLSYAFPMYHFAFAFRRVVLMGAGWRDCMFEISIWLAWATIALLLALVGVHMIMHQKPVEEPQA